MIAGRRFDAGEMVWRLTGKPVFGAVTESGPNYIGLGPNVWIDPDLPLDHINHHCEPNAAFGPRRQLLALRPIEAHEEITIDYSTTEADPRWSMPCSCGAAGCRKMLYAIQHSFGQAPAPPQASPLMQLVWRQSPRRTPMPFRSFRRVPPRFEPAFAFNRRLPLLPATTAAAACFAPAAGASRLPWRGVSRLRVYASLTRRLGGGHDPDLLPPCRARRPGVRRLRRRAGARPG